MNTPVLPFPAKTRPRAQEAELPPGTERDLRLVRWWRSRSIEVLHQLGGDPRHMAVIRGIADELIEGIVAAAEDDEGDD